MRARAAEARVSRGLYRLPPAGSASPDPATLAAWQRALPPGGAFSHLTGALLRGWWVPPLPPDLPVFAAVCGTDPRPRRDGLLVCRHPRPIDMEQLGGLRVASPGEILLAVARDLGLLDLVILGDAALHLGACTPADLRRTVERPRRGAPALGRALTYLDERSESPWESLLRLLHVLCRVPVEPQYVIADRNRSFRGDLRIVGTPRLAEYDGSVHREVRQQAKDLARERRLHQLGWERYGYTASDVLHGGVSILRDADATLGRPHDARRIRPWHRELAASMFSPAGLARVRLRWASQQARQHRARS